MTTHRMYTSGGRVVRTHLRPLWPDGDVLCGSKSMRDWVTKMPSHVTCKTCLKRVAKAAGE